MREREKAREKERKRERERESMKSFKIWFRVGRGRFARTIILITQFHFKYLNQ